MEPSEVEDVLAADESYRVELTVSVTDTGKFSEAICAFANDLPATGKPGFLVIGVDPQTRRPTGIAVTDQLMVNLADVRSNGTILPPPIMSVHRVPLSDGEVLVVKVEPSERPPVRYRGVTHVRIGPRRGRATVEEERRLSERATDNSKTWDMRAASGARLEDLALGIFENEILPRAVAKPVLDANGRTVEERLAALRMYDLRRRAPTNAAVLALGKDPLAHVPGAYVQYVNYDGEDMTAAVLQERRIHGDLLTVMRDLDSLARELAVARPVRSPDLSEVTHYAWPPVALHELFMNAVIHRNYDGSTTPISINVFSDRLEISNPGGLYGDLSQGDPRHGTAYRNPVVAEVAKVLGFVNRFGRGLAIVDAELQKNANAPLLLEPTASFFHARARRRT